MLEIDELAVSYGRVPALKGISLVVEEGETRPGFSLRLRAGLGSRAWASSPS